MLPPVAEPPPVVPVASIVLPPWTTTSPPLPTEDCPTNREMPPLAPDVEEPVCIVMAPLLPAVANPVVAVKLPETPASPAFAVDSVMPPLLELVDRPEEIWTEIRVNEESPSSVFIDHKNDGRTSTEPPVAVSDDEPDWVPAEIVTLPATLVSPGPARMLMLPLLPPVAAPDPIRMEPMIDTRSVII